MLVVHWDGRRRPGGSRERDVPEGLRAVERQQGSHRRRAPRIPDAAQPDGAADRGPGAGWELRLLPDGVHATSAMVAEYYGVGETVIRALVLDHRDELQVNGYHTVTGAELSYFKQLCGATQSRARSLALFTHRTILNTGMLLRDSPVARQVRYELLNDVQDGRPQPVETYPQHQARRRAWTPASSASPSAPSPRSCPGPSSRCRTR